MPLDSNSQGAFLGGGPPDAGGEKPQDGHGGSPQAAGTEQPQAAVAVIRTAGDDPQYLVLRRALNPVDPWSGHFALPGGRREDGDRDLLETCMRETLEETGLLLVARQMVAPLPWARAGGTEHATLVAPFLFEIETAAELTLDFQEIAESHWLPLSYLSDPLNHDVAVMSARHPMVRFPCIKVGSGAIWGFTYGVLKAHLGPSKR